MSCKRFILWPENGMNHQKYQAIGEKIKRKRSRLWPVFATLLFVSGCIMYLGLYSHQKPVNVIFMISDGFGPASQTFARNYYQAVNGLPNNTKLPLDTILIGSSRTRSGNSLVTDSAAGATAFSCGIKTFNGAIGVDLSLNSCKTVLEDASANGILTGLVVTSRITHATPASFAAHVPDRDMESAIATQMIGLQQYGQSVDLMFGGGECFFLPNTSVGSCRKDDQDVYKQASELGFNVHRGIDAFNSLDSDSKLPLLNLFSKDHMDFEIDRAMQPSLLDMTKKAIAILESSPSSKKGYFLMIEGSRIDMAAHTNDPAAHLHEILMYNSVIEYVKGYVKKTNTVMVSTSDHETGGLSLGYQPGIPYPEYKWNPLFLKNIKKSSEYLAKKVIED